MNYADIKQYDVANGLGIRVSLFVSGCTHHCALIKKLGISGLEIPLPKQRLKKFWNI